MRAVLIANGTVSNYETLKKYISDKDFIICADGGYDHAKNLGVTPNVVIGDMDSVKSKEIKADTVVYPRRKDYTDSELVLEYAVENNYDELILLGFIGTRMDHTVTNLSLLCKYVDVDAVILDDNNEIRAVRSDNIIEGKKGDILSIIPLGGCLSGVTTKNLEYPLKNETLFFGDSRGVSNVMTDSSCRIIVKKGMGILIKSKD